MLESKLTNNIHKQLLQHNLKSKLLLQVHDELVFDMYKEEEAKLKLLVEKEMMNAGTLMVSYQPLGNIPNFFRYFK